MDIVSTALWLLVFLLLYLGVGVWVFSGLLLISVTSMLLLLGFPIDRIGAIAKGVIWRSASTWELSAIPMFILMGEIIFRTDISDRLFRGLAPWVEGLPGRLLHTNIFGCTIFAAVSGSSTATTAIVGKITSTALAERNYDRSLAVGSLAGAGSLGLLVPPSILMIIYGVLAEVSISKLFIAGVVPGLLIAALYSSYITARCAIDGSLAPSTEDRSAIQPKIQGLRDLCPVLILIAIVFGGIYSGTVTPSEAAALGVSATIIVAAILKQLSWRKMRMALLSSVRTSCMICTILASAALLSTTIGYLHIPSEIAAAIGALHLSPIQLMVFLGVFYVFLGLFLDGISITVMTLPITLPLVIAAGFDPIWFGVFVVIMVEMGLITPPIGFNLFVLQGMTGESLGTVARASLPFFVLMFIGAAIITLVPDLALWLPGQISH